MSINTFSSAHWRTRIAELGDRVAAAKGEANAARRRRSAAILANGDDRTAELQAAQDVRNAEAAIEALGEAVDAALTCLEHSEAKERAAADLTLQDVARAAKLGRLATAHQFDELVADLVTVICAYNAHGHVLKGSAFSGISALNGMAGVENAYGNLRIMAALPPVIRSLFPDSVHTSIGFVPLGVSEDAIWRQGLGEPDA